jgi:hypothetical protein
MRRSLGGGAAFGSSGGAAIYPSLAGLLAAARGSSNGAVQTPSGGSECRSRVLGEPRDELSGGHRFGEVVGLAGPEVQTVGVAALACRGAEGGGEVVDLGVSARGIC